MLCISANTRVIKQSSLQKFQEEMEAVQKDPYRVVMKQTKVPMSLLHDRVKAHVSEEVTCTGAFIFNLCFLQKILLVDDMFLFFFLNFYLCKCINHWDFPIYFVEY